MVLAEPPAPAAKVPQGEQHLRLAGFTMHMAKAEEYRASAQPELAVKALERAASLQPQDPRPPFQLCMLLTARQDFAAACAAALRAVERAPGRHRGVLPSETTSEAAVPRGVYPQIGLRAAVMAFDLLIRPPCAAVPRPAWWTDNELLAMSARALADTPDSPYALSVRAHCLVGLRGASSALGWQVGLRTASQLREASALLKRQALLEAPGSAEAVRALRKSAAIFEVAMRVAATEEAARRADAAVDVSDGGAADGTLASAPTSPTKPASPTSRTAALRARQTALEQQVAALERQLAAGPAAKRLA